MKNLIDELHELDDNEIKVSSDFSKNVMKKIKKSNRIIALGYVASIASVACVIGVTVFFVNKNGLLDKFIGNASSQSASVMTLDAVSQDKIEKEEKDIEYKTDSQGVEVNKEAVREEAVSAPNVVNDAVNQTYSKQLSKEKYLNEILNKLKVNSYDVSETDDGIIVYSNDFNKVYELLEEYIDIELSLSGDRIIIQLIK